jgi:pimeloyl-ACP methyl ester carboxylesterase
MPTPSIKLVLLPGMDGTGELFNDFVKELPEGVETVIVQYPEDNFLSYQDLESFIQSAIPATEPFVLLAESFSTPLAIRFAAKNYPNLKALIICAGFITSPIKGWRRHAAALLSPILFRIPLTESAARIFLLGSDAPASLIASVQAAIALVKPGVLIARLGAIFACNARTELSQVAVPILYIQGKQDRMVSARSFEEILEIRPRTVVAAINGLHLILQREPERCTEAIAQFIADLPTR